MKTTTLYRPLVLIAGALLVFPSLYFFVSAVLNHFGLPALWKVIEPVFDLAANKTRGFNINFLILFGPLIAIAINLPQVIRLHFSKSDEEMSIFLSVAKYKYSWLVIGTAAACLCILFFYMIAENCMC